MSNSFLEGPKRAILVLIVCLVIGSLGVVAQQAWGEKLSGDAVGIVGLGALVPLFASVWGARRRGEIRWAPVIYGAAGGAGQVLALLIPTVATLVAYPNPKHPLLWVIGLGGLTLVLSAGLGAVVGLVVMGLLAAFGVRPPVPETDTEADPAGLPPE